MSFSSITRKRKYTVFISHAGEDKHTIAIPLHKRLRSHGITAFVDELDMPPGTRAEPEMTYAMDTADIAVIVLSPEFVARKWPMKELMAFLRRADEAWANGRILPIIIPFFYRLTIDELYHEPRLDRLDKDGNPLYLESRFFERMKKGEPEANVKKIKEVLKSVHGFMGIRNDLQATNESSDLMTRSRDKLLDNLCYWVKEAKSKCFEEPQESHPFEKPKHSIGSIGGQLFKAGQSLIHAFEGFEPMGRINPEDPKALIELQMAAFMFSNTVDIGLVSSATSDAAQKVGT